MSHYDYKIDILSDKFKRAVKNKNLLKKIYKNTIAFYRINNDNTYVLNEECKVYSKYARRYKNILEAGVNIHDLKQAQSNKVWVCWLQGMEEAPALVRACFESVKKNLPDADIHLITNYNLFQYVDFPPFITDKVNKGIIPRAHFSDLIRLELLTKYGGTWIDATVLLTGNELPAFAIRQPLFVFKQMNLTNGENPPIVASSWFISSYSNNPILVLTRNLLHEYWKTHQKIENYYLFHIFFALSVKRYPEIWKSVPLCNNHTPHQLSFQLDEVFCEEKWLRIIKDSDIHKLNRHKTASQNGNSFYDYIIGQWKQDATRDCTDRVCELGDQA